MKTLTIISLINLMNVSTDEEIPWLTDFANYLIRRILRKGLTYAQRCKFFSDLKHYFRDKPYVSKMCPDGMIGRSVYGSETPKILDACHHGPTGGNYDEMPQNSIQVSEIFDIWGIDFMGTFPKSHKFEYILVAIDYMSKLAEAEALPTNGARVIVNFLKRLFSCFGILKALIGDRAYKTPIGTKPYRLLYRKTCHFPFKIEHRAYWALRNCNPDLKIAGEKRFFQLHKLDELRLQAYDNSKLYKTRTKAYHDKNLIIRKELKVGDKLLFFN
ncbi:reverse transcriptase domain-containing protein [Tanacetum coccineum]|uniref:Reverse transcriptase domain-containing protein n=1 Tax=Tanacetum coccineum TaxID=301880 RepID=A0ABQ5I600_9ASTR